ncbi:MAG: SPOR domain-containing protein [Wenzhouxiangellaceae bacterium]|nr:SPOR domain-containing protein [Wenzhouxiangellaceae bacterium]
MDKILKRRLIGASILIALAVIFLPMLLVDPDAVGDGSNDEVDVPTMPEAAREVRRIPLNPEAARATGAERGPAGRDAAPDGGAEPDAERVRPDEAIVLRPDLEEARPSGRDDASADDPPPAVPDSEPPSESESEPDAAEPEPESAAESESPESGRAQDEAPPPETDSDPGAGQISLGDWVVQVASFGSAESAEEVRARLEALGHVVSRDEIVRGQSVLHRLRTGPYTSREAAEQALQQISTTVAGVEPIVREIDRDLRAGMDAGFAVQVGSFVSEDNAESETERLADLAFESFRFSEQVGERIIWRVMVGPVAERSAAERLKARLAEQAGVEGLVVSYP